MNYYLRLEAVNLKNFIDDTQDLSTTRGGGLLLLDAVEKLPGKLPSLKLKPVTTGASSGLFSFEGADSAAAYQVRQEVENLLNADNCFRHATFVVDVWAAGEAEDFIGQRERLLALNRWRQMRQPALAVPPENTADKAGAARPALFEACEVDLVRPATAETDGQDKAVDYVSESVKCRREFGRDQKQDFYFSRTGFPGQFTRTFDQLSDQRGSGVGDDRSNLHHKMAVIYLDGNNFGKIQDKVARCEDDQRRWDEQIKKKRNLVLQSLLFKMEKDPEWKWKGKVKGVATELYRIETLIWGGDDLLWVVPAWKGWETLAHFFTLTANWQFQGHPLTHAAGLVFCHHKAPIQRLTDLARRLAYLAKNKDAEARKKNLFAYEVLESFDHIGHDDIGRYRQERCPWHEKPKDRAQELILAGEKMAGVIKDFAAVKEVFPRRQLHRIVQGFRKKNQVEARTTVASVRAALDEATQASLDKLKECFGDSDTLWFHLAALWDYVA